MLTIVVLGAASFLLAKLNSKSGKLRQAQQTAVALAQAKEALIGYALTYTDQGRPGQPQGYLPCPDMNGNGTAFGACSNKGESVIGRLPWRTLGIPALRDGSGECLWYVVSGTYKNNPKLVLTSDTEGLLLIKSEAGATLIGSTPAERAIAIVFAPGPIVAQQDRSFALTEKTECGSDIDDPVNLPVNFLESLGSIDNATGLDSAVIEGDPGSDPMPAILPSVFVKSPVVKDSDGNIMFNDSMLVIKPADFINVYQRMDKADPGDSSRI